MFMQLSSFVRVELGMRPGSSWKKALLYFETVMRLGQGLTRAGSLPDRLPEVLLSSFVKFGSFGKWLHR
jgi:hypothetical protein